jgi:3-dehydro-L-gulonate 2-dehydrogenase
MLRVSYQELFNELNRALLKLGFESERASLCARLFTETTCDGVYSHGLNRFSRFVTMIHNGSIDVHARPELTVSCGAVERWDGKLGVGNLNAYQSMERALALARQHGIGCIAMANTNHWMRGGTYGWQAADGGMIGICWTNTLANLPPWGASDPRLGNNPLVIAVPRPAGHVVLDMAMSQFSYGALTSYQMSGKQLPVNGGYDLEGQLTTDPRAIEASGRPLPIGYWKGSGLALLLDLMASLLSGGQATHQISTDPERETGLSQVFVAIDLAALDQNSLGARLADQVIGFLQLSSHSAGERVRYPGERVLQTRKESLEHGIPVELSAWHELQTISENVND